MVKSRYNYVVYVNYLFILLFITVIILSLWFHWAEKNAKSRIGITVILLLTIFLFYITAKWANKIFIGEQTISIKGLFKKKTINYSEIASINLFSFESFYWASGLTTIATRLNLINGEKIIIADPFYKNIGKIKTALCENFKEKIEAFQSPSTGKITAGTILETDFEKFSGNPYTSFNGLMILGWTIFIFWLLLGKIHFVPAHLFLIVPILFIYLAFGYQLNYFLVSNEHLIVKNHFLFWVNKKYAISGIVAANFESPYRRSRALRIINKDFTSKLYCAGSLRDRHWNALREKLEELRVHFVET